MNVDLAALPDDVETLQKLVRSLVAERISLSKAKAEIERLNLIIKRLQRNQYGRRAERLDDEQLQLGFEDLNADLAHVETSLPPPPAESRPPRPQSERPSLPVHLPREDVRLDVEHQTCPCCGGILHLIGETTSEMLDHVPARLRVIRICRPRYGCRACGTIHQAPAPERPIAKGLASPALLSHVLVSKYCDHLPLYRQSQIFARQGVTLDRSTLANWIGGACWWLEPLQSKLAEHIFASQKLFADDTPIPVLDPGRGRTKTGRLWVYARDDRPWNGPDPPAAVYLYSPDRKAERPAAHLANFSGIVQVDGYPGFDRLRDGGTIQLAACWAHARRKFYEVQQATASPVATEALRRVAELYVIEAAIRGQTAEARQSMRRSKSLPLVTAMKAWLEMQLAQIPPRGGLADATRYALSRWDALCCFLNDGRIELDTNTVERAIRPVTLGRKNHLFAGSDGGAQRWATVCSLITTAKLNDVEPFTYLKDILERMSAGHPMSRLDQLLPWNWRPATILN
ncbi:putative transposase [Nitrobacter sp. Nb-311A]|uniref:Transposase n=3 Tax=Nitrobacter TaxID=911 RepID=A0ACC6AD00_NITWI|nr:MULTISPECIES: IS66 family transposase [Nitrobacter]EAQ33572.1 putative transposase [Nitrobacter sp. Nb-311A]MCP1997603.1 transposase [Nitrobacter winogradskyi]GEC17089.1 transposase [Nitrobacter winogradskyi]